MKFLVILSALLANYLWLKDFDRFDDGWFFRFRGRVESGLGVVGRRASNIWILAQCIIYLVPILTLFLVLTLIQGQVFGVPTMLLHILVLLVALDRTQPGRLAKGFLEHFASGNLDSCRSWLKSELAVASDVDLGDRVSIGRYFSRQLTYRCFERMFVMYFWYLVTGPVGVVFCYISYQLRDSHREDQPSDEVKFVKLVVAVLEWIPLRLLALTFSLAGNFVHSFNRIRGSFWSFQTGPESGELLYGCAAFAVGGMAAEEDEGSSGLAGSESVQQSQWKQEAQHIEALQALLERSQSIWLALLALGTIFALP